MAAVVAGIVVDAAEASFVGDRRYTDGKTDSSGDDAGTVVVDSSCSSTACYTAAADGRTGAGTEVIGFREYFERCWKVDGRL